MVGCSENHPVEFASQSQRQPATANVTGRRTSIPFGHHAIPKTLAVADDIALSEQSDNCRPNGMAVRMPLDKEEQVGLV